MKRKRGHEGSSAALSVAAVAVAAVGAAALRSLPTSVPPVVEGFNMHRIRPLNNVPFDPHNRHCVVYWMSRDQRVFDNHAMHYAQGLSKQIGVPLRVVFNLVPKFLEATIRHYDFMIKGLKEVELQLNELDIPFHVLLGSPVTNVARLATDTQAAAVITDFSPLRTPLQWTRAVGEALELEPSGQSSSCSSSSSSSSSSASTRAISVPVWQVDAHNVIPCWFASDKCETAARTFRPKVHAKFAQFLTEIPAPTSNDVVKKSSGVRTEAVDWNAVYRSLEVDMSVLPVEGVESGHSAGWRVFDQFVEGNGLANYESKRNDPNEDVQSGLSPYFHFGQIGVQAVIWRLKRLRRHHGSTDAFIEEAVVRRELSDNFCFYNPTTYDSLDGCSAWALDTLQTHRCVITKCYQIFVLMDSTI
jgi:deoxyribodipyrimidine photo-lyase